MTTEILATQAAPVRSRPKSRHLYSVPGSNVNAPGPLSDREVQVVKLVADGLSNKQIGTRLGLSDKTIKNHLSHIMRKLCLTTRTQVAVQALRQGIA